MPPEHAIAALALNRIVAPGRGGDGPLCGVSLAIPAGAFCVLTGPAGSGASTLVGVIADRHGDALRVDPATLVPRFSVYDNIALGLSRRGVARSAAEERTLRAAEAMDLGPLLASAARRLSPDERWRVALARALAHRPPLLLFDEPLAGLGSAARLALRRAIRRLQGAVGATVVCASRDVADALALADLLVVMDGGAVLQSGPPAALYDSPASAMAAQLAGPFGINLLPVRADQTGLSLEDGTTLGAASVMTTAAPGVLGVRPEHLFALGDDGPPPHGLSLPLRVETVERTGADAVLHGHVGAHPVTARLAGPCPVAPGAVVRLGARRERLHMFDAGTLAAMEKPAVAASPPPVAPPRTIPPHLQRDPRDDDAERAQHERRLAAARARLSS